MKCRGERNDLSRVEGKQQNLSSLANSTHHGAAFHGFTVIGVCDGCDRQERQEKMRVEGITARWTRNEMGCNGRRDGDGREEGRKED